MKMKEERVLSYGLKDVPVLCVAAVFISLYEIGKLAKRLRGIEEPPRPKAAGRKQNKLIGEIFG